MRSSARRYLYLACGVGSLTLVGSSDVSFGREPTAAETRWQQLFSAVWGTRERLTRQEQALAAQARRLEEQAEALERQRQQLEALQGRLLEQQRALGLPGAGTADAPPQVTAAAPPRPAMRPAGRLGLEARPQVAQAAPAAPNDTPAATDQVPVGEPPAREPERPEVRALAESGGVLTPAGTLVLSPSLELTHSSQNRLTFRGVEIVESVLVGVIEATDADRDLLTAAVTGRYGVTDRFELEARVPYLYRDDRLTNLVQQQSGDVAVTQSVDGMGLGDIELAGHYQLNSGLDDWPIFVGNLRVKTPTGTGPFDVDRDAFGIETELPTGTGFWSVEPSLTAIYPSDPAVFFGNLSYIFNIPDDVDERVGESLVGEVDPGDAVGVSVGMGFGINERSSFSIGYKHNFIMSTETEIDGRTLDSDPADVGLLALNLSHRLNERTVLVLDLEFGMTEDAPDVRAVLSVPISFPGF